MQKLDSPSTTSAVTYKITLSGADATNVYVQKDSKQQGKISIVRLGNYRKLSGRMNGRR